MQKLCRNLLLSEYVLYGSVCLWVVCLSEMIVYLICHVFADLLENTHEILQRHLRVRQKNCAVSLFFVQ